MFSVFCFSLFCSAEIAKVDSTPKQYATDGDSIGVVATVTQVVLLRDGKVVFKTAADYDPLCVAVHPNKTEIAVGGKVRRQFFCVWCVLFRDRMGCMDGNGMGV